MWDRLSPAARRVMSLALEESEQSGYGYAEGRGEAAVTPEHLLYGVLRDLDHPYGAQLGRRARKHLTQLGWTIGTVNPAGALLQARGIDLTQLRAELDRTP